MKRYFISAVLMIAAISCKKNSQNNSTSLSGVYVESSPTANENQLNFINSNQVIITSKQTANQLNLTPGTFKYQIDGIIMKLISTSLSKPDTTAYLINVSGNNNLTLDFNCGCICPCAAPLNIIFAKK